MYKLTTSVGRKYLGFTLTRTIPVSLSLPTSANPLPSHLVRGREGKKEKKVKSRPQLIILLSLNTFRHYTHAQKTTEQNVNNRVLYGRERKKASKCKHLRKQKNGHSNHIRFALPFYSAGHLLLLLLFIRPPFLTL